MHIDFSLKLFELQRRMGNFFLFEYPKRATSWKLNEVETFMKKPGVIEAIAKMCQFQIKTRCKGEEGLVSKPTRFLTNSPEVAKRLNRRIFQKNVVPKSTRPSRVREPERRKGIPQHYAAQWLMESKLRNC